MGKKKTWNSYPIELKKKSGNDDVAGRGIR